jgi:purine-binding chemotaxis protein CheW
VTTTSFLDTSAPVRACIVRLGGRHFGLDVASVREVVVFEDWTIVPLAPPHVIGVANLRGAVMPIVDAQPELGLPPRRVERRLRTAVLGAEGLEAAIVIDDVVTLEAFSEVTPLDDAPAAAHTRHAHGWLRRDAGAVPLLDAAPLLHALRTAATRPAA